MMGSMWLLQGACSQRNESRSESGFRSWFGPFPDLKAWVYPLWTQSYFKSVFWNVLLKHEKRGVLDRDPPRKPDSEDMSTQNSFGTWFVRVHFGNARWTHAWVNLRSRNIILPRSVPILFVIGMAVAMLVNAHSSNGFRNVISSFVKRPRVIYGAYWKVATCTP